MASDPDTASDDTSQTFPLPGDRGNVGAQGFTYYPTPSLLVPVARNHSPSLSYDRHLDDRARRAGVRHQACIAPVGGAGAHRVAIAQQQVRDIREGAGLRQEAPDPGGAGGGRPDCQGAGPRADRGHCDRGEGQARR
eukprot:362109-Pyramimonas_sp.AAC.1